MKPDEEFAIKHLEKFLKLIGPHKFYDGDDPPDCFGLFPLQRIGVEITQIGPIYIERDQQTITKRDFDYPIADWATNAPREVAMFVPPDFTLYCHIKGPIENFSKFKKNFSKTINNLINNNQIQQKTKEFQIGTAFVDLSMRPHNNPLGSAFIDPSMILHNNPLHPVIITIGGIEHNLPLQYNLNVQTEASIDIALQDKHKKCRRCKERIWLLLINTHPLIDRSDLERVNQELFRGTYFEKIWVVDPQGSVYLIFAQNSSLIRYLKSFFGWICAKLGKAFK